MKKILSFSIFSWAAFASAATPTIDAAYPAGGKIGTEVEVVFVGKSDPWPAKFWASDPGLTFVPDEKRERVGKFKIDAKTKPGPIWFRFFNDEGVSEPRLFYAGTLTEFVESKETDHQSLKSAQKIEPALPVVVNGRLGQSNEADFFSLPLKKGQTLHAALDGYSLRSPIDPMLHIYDSSGARLLLKHDGPTNLDPRFEFTVPRDGDFVIGVFAIPHPAASKVSFQGSSACVYRLALTKNKKALPAHFHPKTDAVTFLKKPHTPHRLTRKAKKGEQLLVKVEAFALGFPTDPVLRILKPDGALLREVDDVKPTRDAEYLWKVSADGDYPIEVADRFGRAGPDIGFRLTIKPPKPDFSATADKHSYATEVGKETELKIKITRLHEHEAELKIKPPKIDGVEFEIGDVPKTSGNVTVKIQSKKPFSGPMRFQVSGKPVSFSIQDSASRGPFLKDEIEDLWLTITDKKD